MNSSASKASTMLKASFFLRGSAETLSFARLKRIDAMALHVNGRRCGTEFTRSPLGEQLQRHAGLDGGAAERYTLRTSTSQPLNPRPGPC